MSESERSRMLGCGGHTEIDVSLPKLEPSHFDPLDIASGSLTSIGSHSQHYATSSSNNNTISLDSVMVSASGVITSSEGIAIAPDDCDETYGNVQYVAPVVPLGDQKFSESIVSVPVDNVTFVEMNENSLKTSGVSGAPLDIYFGVIPTTSITPVVSTTTSTNIKHEHMNPKAQILERVYSDYILQEQQKQHEASHDLVSLDDANAILPHPIDNIGEKISQNSNVTHFRRCLKPSQLRSNVQTQQKQLILQDSNSTVNESIHTSDERIIQITNKDLNSENIDFQPLQHHISLQPNQSRKESAGFKIVSSTDNSVNNQHVQETQSQTFPLVSRSGRLIRRRPEYIAYVNENNQESKGDEIMVSEITATNHHNIKSESMLNDDIDVQVTAFDGILDHEDPDDDQFSNNDDAETTTHYGGSDGRKSLPHKKRIPRKLKNSKRNVKDYKCLQCEEQFNTQQQLNQHKATHANSTIKSKTFNCELCVKSFDNQLRFFEHLKTHYEPFKKHRCEVCAGEFDNANALQEHSAVHLREHFKCDVCNRTFRKESMLEAHIKVSHLDEDDANSTIEKPYTCMVCPKRFTNQMALDGHVRTDHDENPPEFNCEDCYRSFKSEAKLTSHRKTEHKEEGTRGRGAPRKKAKANKGAKPAFQCYMCPRTFIHKNSLVYHIRGHTGERPHQCTQCGKAFYAASALKVHLRLHSGEKPYKCEDCGKFFRQWGDLRYHTSSVHSDARQYQCEYCGKDFKRKYCLVVHRRIHTGEKNYKCDYCGKAFRAASYLQNHKRIHTGERPHPCPDCGKPFRVKSDMKRHRQTHTRETNHSTTNTSTPAPDATTSLPVIEGPVRRTLHSQGHIQIVQAPVGTTQNEHQLILTDPTGVNNEQSIRIMVSGLGASDVGSATNPPPAHIRSDGSLTVAAITPSSPNDSNQEIGNSLAPEVIMLDESSQQPINLNILPRMIAQTRVAPIRSQTSQETLVTTEEEYRITNANRNAIEMREEGGVYVWHNIGKYLVN